VSKKKPPPDAEFDPAKDFNIEILRHITGHDHVEPLPLDIDPWIESIIQERGVKTLRLVYNHTLACYITYDPETGLTAYLTRFKLFEC
jgi:hypothetical protein